MDSTVNAMFSMYSNIAQNNWAEVLPFIQIAHNMYFSLTMHETPFFLMFGRQARLLIDCERSELLIRQVHQFELGCIKTIAH